MAKEPEPEDIRPYQKGTDTIKQQVLSSVLSEHDLFLAQREKRIELLRKMEELSTPAGRAGYLAFLSSEAMGASIGSDDIPAIGDALLSLGEVDELNLIINSPPRRQKSVGFLQVAE